MKVTKPVAKCAAIQVVTQKCENPQQKLKKAETES